MNILLRVLIYYPALILATWLVWRMLPEFKDVTKAHAELAKQVADEARQVRNAISSRLEDDA